MIKPVASIKTNLTVQSAGRNKNLFYKKKIEFHSNRRARTNEVAQDFTSILKRSMEQLSMNY